MLLRAWKRRQPEVRAARERPFRQAAKSLGLPEPRPGRFFGKVLQGEVGGCAVRYVYSVGGESIPAHRCRAGYPGGPLGTRLVMKRRGAWFLPQRKSSLATGDESFDALMYVRSTSPVSLQVALDAPTRREILDLAFDGSLAVDDRRVAISQAIKNPETAEIVEFVGRAVALAQTLGGSAPRL
jgi:hypothetical protein